MRANLITSAENARRITVVARVLDVPARDLMAAMVWIDGEDTPPAWVPIDERDTPAVALPRARP